MQKITKLKDHVLIGPTFLNGFNLFEKHREYQFDF